jgi:ribonuclease R
MVKRKSKIKDPYAAREAQNYSEPVPSREFILEHMEKRDGPAFHDELCQEFNLTNPDQIEAIRRRLIAMCRDGQMFTNRVGAFIVLDRENLLTGIVSAHPDGFGFVSVEGQKQDIMLQAHQMRGCLHGDRVTVRVTSSEGKGRKEGRIVEINERNTTNIVGRFYQKDGVISLIPENPKICNQILINPQETQHAEDGDMISCEITHQPSFRKSCVVKVSEIIGRHMAPGMEIQVALRSFDIPHIWPEEVLTQIAPLTEDVSEAEKIGRVDLTNKAFVTIDGEDARDFDDAVYASRSKAGGYTLYVAIADVSHYVQNGTPLDEEARNRATSVYFPQQVIPMLPEVLSNGLCSLKPKVDRLSMVCEMQISPAGQTESFKFYEAVIHSHARLTYTQVGNWLFDGNDEEAIDGKKVKSNLVTLKDLYYLLKTQRKTRGAIDFETREPFIMFNEERKIETFGVRERNDAHKLIEECMLCANVASANFMQQLEIEALFRVHEAPAEERLVKLRAWLAELGLQLGGGEKPSSKDYQSVIKQTQDRPDFEEIQTMLLRSMSQARYQPDNQGHFGLGYEAYTHFTSPIRRYPDLTIHRAIRAKVRSGQRTPLVRRVKDTKKQSFESWYPYDLSALLELGEQCSLAERRADDATRDVIGWLKCEFMMDKVGDEFEGKITAVKPFGLFIQLNDYFVDGLIHISELKSDYYHYHEAKQRLIGESSRISYGLGDEITIQVARVDLDDRKIDFILKGANTDKPKGDSNKSKSKPFKKSDKSFKSPESVKDGKGGTPKAKKARRISRENDNVALDSKKKSKKPKKRSLKKK